jgi:hypothetical protein
MHKKVSFTLLTLSIVAAALFFVSHSSSASANSNPTLAPVYEHNNDARFFGNPQHKTGDRIEFANPVYDAANQKVIGSSDGECFYASNTVYQCSWTLMLANGNIVLEGAQGSQQTRTVYAIVGGTGAYCQIQGEAVLTSTGNITNGEAPVYRYTFHLAQL